MINLSYAEFDPNESVDLRFHLERLDTEFFELIDVIGVDESSSNDIGSRIRHVAELEMFGSGDSMVFSEAEIRFVFVWNDYAGFNYDFWFDAFVEPSSTPCQQYNWDNITSSFGFVDGVDFFFIDRLVEEGSLPLSGRTTDPRTANNPFESNLQIQGDFEVDVDYTMEGINNNIDDSYIIMCGDKNIVVKNNSVLDISHYNIMSNDDRWGSIIVENGSTLIISDCIVEGGTNNIVVENGGTLIIDDVVLKDASQSGLLLEDNSNSTIENVTIEDCKIGLIVEGDPNTISLKNNTFQNNSTGVRVEDSSNQVDLTTTQGNENYYLDNDVGLYVSSGSVEVSNSVFDDNLNSVFMWSAFDVEVFNCDIGFINTAFTANFSDFSIYDNNIGGSGVTTGSRAFYGIANPQYSIRNNSVIEANDLISFMYFSYGSFDENIMGDSSNPPRGLHHIFSLDTITDNDIYSSHTNILLNGAFDGQILNNEWYDADFGFFGVGGTKSTLIDNNITDANNSGVRLDNSSGNTISCNDINSDRALWINQNSDMQVIETNDLDGNDEDIMVESMLGVQFHHANNFFGEVLKGRGLTGFEAEASVFVVDENEPDFIPNLVDPVELLDPVPFSGSQLSCSGSPGNDIGQKFLDTTFICTYLDSTNAVKTTNPNLYWNRIAHMMKFLTYKIPVAQWPSCIKNFWLNEDLCGLKEMVSKEVNLKKYLSGELVAYQDVFEFRDSLADLVNSQRSELYTLECTDSIANIWIDTYLLLSKRLKGDTLTLPDRTVLDGIASLCAYEYGDAVHWARSLMSEYSSTDYYTNDNCNINTAQRSRDKIDINTSKGYAAIYPNPTSGVFVIESKIDSASKLILTDINGRKMIEEDIKGSIHEVDISSFPKGVYFISVYDSGKLVITEKLILQ